MAENKKYDSKVSFEHKRLDQVREAAEVVFRESLLWIKVDHNARKFIIYVEDKSDIEEIKYFEGKFKMCRIKIFKEISLEALRAPYLKTAGR